MKNASHPAILLGDPLEPSIFRDFLRSAGLNQSEFARLIRRNPMTVSSWAVGRHPVPTEITLALILMMVTPEWRARIACAAWSSVAKPKPLQPPSIDCDDQGSAGQLVVGN